MLSTTPYIAETRTLVQRHFCAQRVWRFCDVCPRRAHGPRSEEIQSFPAAAECENHPIQATCYNLTATVAPAKTSLIPHPVFLAGMRQALGDSMCLIIDYSIRRRPGLLVVSTSGFMPKTFDNPPTPLHSVTHRSTPGRSGARGAFQAQLEPHGGQRV